MEADVSPSSGIWVPVCVCFGSDADVSPVIGVRAPRLPFCVCFGSDADVSPVIGIQAPRLPLCVSLGSDADISPVIGSRAPRLPVSCLFVCVSAELRML